MNYDEALAHIHSLERLGTIFGLERISALLEKLGNPQKEFKIIHVAGTNGKGSTSAMFSQVLMKAGYKTGLYISPFVEDFRERIQIDRTMIPKERLAELVDKIIPLADEIKAEHGVPVTEFEFNTAVALKYYAEEKCDYAVLEVGMGGRFDATNAIRDPELSVICSIAYDHCAILGDTLAKIAFEKCGIIKDCAPVVTYPEQQKEALDVIKAEAAKKGSELIIPDIGRLEILELRPDGNRFIYCGTEYELSIPGEHIIKNSLAVIEGAKLLSNIGRITGEVIRAALAEVRFGGRFEQIGKDPLFYIDAAHNPDCVNAITKLLDKVFSDKKLIIIMGMLRDKDYEYCISEIAKRAYAFIAVTPNSPRALPASKAAETAKKYCGNVIIEESISSAVSEAVNTAKKTENSMILSLGSLYYIGEVKRIYQNEKTGNI